jgi:hypothetical protein
MAKPTDDDAQPASEAAYVPTAAEATGQGQPASADRVATTRSRTESPYARAPAHFDEKAYRDWMKLLSEPWQA